MSIHADLEDRLAEFEGTEAALLFGSGYLANTGAIAALARRGEVVFSDELNHASIIDGCRLAGAETFVYRHARHGAPRMGAAPGGGPRRADRHRRRLLHGRRHRAARGPRRPWRGRHGCRLMVDEAHATGCVGPGGRGSVAAAGLTGEVDVIVGTLGKALGGLRRLRLRLPGDGRLPDQHRAAVHLLHRPAPAGRRRGLGRARAAGGEPQARREAAGERGRAARGPARRGPGADRLATRRSSRW